jgi:hypothetical protein
MFLAAVFQFTEVNSKDIPFQLIEIEQLSRYNEDRLAYQHTEADLGPIIDNSLSSLLIIKDSKIYLIKDGYDDGYIVQEQRQLLEMENRLIGDLWVNKIDNKPDYIRVTDRRVEVLKNISQEFVTNNFGEFYTSVRDRFLQKHVNIFKALMINRKESGLFVERTPLPKRAYDEGPTKFRTVVTGKTIDEKIYYAEDADGDNITETFSVTIPDGFNWGYKSGANIVFIYKNKQENIKNIIGKLATEAYSGTPEEENIIKNEFPQKDDINDMIDDLYRSVDPTLKKIEENKNK